jgi:hypothetical protein
LIPVYNPAPAIGKQTVPIYPLSANLVFRRDGLTVANVAKGFWIEQSFNEVDIEIGDHKYLLLATEGKDGIVAWGNRAVPREMSFSNDVIPNPDAKAVILENHVEIEVALIVNKTTVARFYVDVTRTDDARLHYSLRG